MMKDFILVAIFFSLLFNFRSSWITKLYKTNNKEKNLERKKVTQNIIL